MLTHLLLCCRHNHSHLSHPECAFVESNTQQTRKIACVCGCCQGGCSTYNSRRNKPLSASFVAFEFLHLHNVASHASTATLQAQLFNIIHHIRVKCCIQHAQNAVFANSPCIRWLWCSVYVWIVKKCVLTSVVPYTWSVVWKQGYHQQQHNTNQHSNIHTHTEHEQEKRVTEKKKSLSKWQLIYFPTLHRTKNLHSCLHICCWLGENAIHTDCNSYRGFSSFCLSRGAPRMNIFFRCLSSVSGAVPSVFHHVHCRQSLFLRPYVVAAASPLLPLTATVVCLPKCHHIALAIRGARDQLHILRTHILYTRWRI